MASEDAGHDVVVRHPVVAWMRHRPAIRPKWLYERGKKLLNEGDVDSAVSSYTEAIRLDPNNAQAYVGRASGYFRQRRFDDAIADDTEAIRLDPNASDVYGDRAHGFREKGS